MKNKLSKIFISDIGSYSLPYDIHYLKTISKFVEVVFICSDSSLLEEDLKTLSEQQTFKVIIVERFGTSVFGKIRCYFKYLNLLISNKSQYNVIHFIWHNRPFFDILMCKLLSKKIILTVHNTISHSPYGFERIVNKIIFSIPDKLVAVSEYNVSRFSTEQLTRAILLPHGPLKLGSVVNKNTSKKQKQKGIDTLCFVGTVKSYKGIEILLKHADELKKMQLSIEIWGKWSAEMIDKKAEFENAGIKVIDKFLSNNELHNLIFEEKLFVLPYKSHSQSGILSLLIFYECPFIAANTGENGRLLTKYGIQEASFNIYSKTSFFRAIEFALKNRTIMQKAINSIKNDHRWSKTHSKDIITSLYKD